MERRSLFNSKLMQMGAFLVLLALIGVIFIPKAKQTFADTVSGIVFNDYNGNGLIGTHEFGVANVTVRAFDSTNALLQTTTTASNGSYSLAGLPANTKVRIEFSGFPLGYESGPVGSQSSSTVQFINSNATNANLGINRPSQYCQANPELVTSCYIYGGGDVNGPTGGAQYDGTRAAVISFPNTAGTTSQTSNSGVANPTTHTIMRPYSEVGTVWGMAYQRRTGTMFTSAFMKRHSRLGPNGMGAIYRVNTTNPATPATLFVDLNALFSSNVFGTNPHPLDNNYFNDLAARDAVAKSSFGDIDMSEDDATIWAMNLSNRQLYQIPVGIPAVAPTLASEVTAHPLPDPGTGATGCPFDSATPVGELNRNLRPGAVKAANNVIYIGLTCTAESTQLVSDLRSFVYAFDPVAVTWNQVANFSLNYNRGYAAVNRGNLTNALSANWRPWPNATVYASAAFPTVGPYGQQRGYPQPWLIDIEFDERGAMIVGFADRFGHQSGNNNASVGPIEGVSAGELLRLASSGSTWILESNGSSGGQTSAGAGNGQGPGGGEFFSAERYELPNPASSTHDEISLGALAYILGNGQVINNVFDPAPVAGTDSNGHTQTFRSGGISWFDRDTGQRARSYMLYYVDEPLTYGKASGIGDIEPLCRSAPIEIGNRVWYDPDVDGVQDPASPSPTSAAPGDFPMGGVQVQLYDGNGVLLATTTTDVNGNYLFTNANVPAGLSFFTNYEIRIQLAQSALDNLAPTTANPTGTNINDANDSDGVANVTYVATALNTGGPGANNHTYDFGFRPLLPTAVDVLSFVAEAHNHMVDVQWATSLEEDIAGFHVYRATSDDRSSAMQVSAQVIPARGFPSVYTWTDANVQPEQTYFYWLQAVHVDGSTTERGPVSSRVPLVALEFGLYLPVVQR